VQGDVTSLPLAGLLADLASPETTTAGGPAAAVAIAMAAALAEMGASASVGRWDAAAGTVAQARTLRTRIAPLVQADADAYGRALHALEGGGDGGDHAIGEALTGAADVLLEIARIGADTAELAQLVAELGAPRHRDDARAAVLLAEAGTRVAAALVAANLATTEDDARGGEAATCVRAAGAARERIAV
jgi:methenyltetrahydrofolate cyclohydrolase